MIAAELARGGRSVVVLEMGQYRNESDFKQLELPGMLELYLGGGLTSSEDGSIVDPRRLDARRRHGRQLHELHPHARSTIREEWAAMGIEGIDEPGLRARTSTRSGSGSAVNDDGDLAEPHPQS